MGIYSVVEWFAQCDWCGKKEKVSNRPSPELWVTDWEHRDEPIYCSETHMARARQVAALKALP